MQRRNTNQRKLIYEILKNTNIHPTADWIYEQVRKEISNISLGTVYRNLKVLKEEGKIIEISDGKQSRFDARTDKHFHFKCSSCGGIYDIDKDGVVDINESKLANMGYFIQDVDVVFTGICFKCKGGEN